ncbi:response regulator [Bacteroidota bacterium]
MKRIYICDDHALFVEGVISSLSTYSEEFEVVGTANNGFQAAEEIRQLSPDIVLLDLNLPIKTGLEVLEELRVLGETPAFIIITSYNDPDLMNKVRVAGGNAYLLKDAHIDEMIATVREVKTGGFLNNPKIVFTEGNVVLSDGFTQVVSLTAREKQVMMHLSKGASTSYTAQQLFISENTVKNHRKNIYRKLDVSTIQELILYCNRLGLLD